MSVTAVLKITCINIWQNITDGKKNVESKYTRMSYQKENKWRGKEIKQGRLDKNTIYLTHELNSWSILTLIIN